MITKWYNTDAMNVMRMTDVNDELIRNLSNGEVTKDSYDDEVEGTINDDIIFGELKMGKEMEQGENSLRMGHIELDNPVVNIQYFLGKCPVLMKKLDMSKKDLEKIIYYAGYVVVESDNEKYPYKNIITYDEYMKNMDDSITMLTGAQAIEYLLIKEKIEGRENIILHTVPVIPMCMRYIRNDKSDTHYSAHGINMLYDGIIRRKTALQRLLSVGAPAVILNNEKRMLQENVDCLISNGLHGDVRTIGFSPIESFDEIHHFIVCPKREQKKIPEIHIDKNLYKKAMDDYIQYQDENFEEGEMVSVDDGKEVRLEELEEIIGNTFNEYTEAYVNLNYERYTKFMKDIINFAAKHAYSDTVGYYMDKEVSLEDNLIPNIEYGIRKKVDLFIKKKVKWLSV